MKNFINRTINSRNFFLTTTIFFGVLTFVLVVFFLNDHKKIQVNRISHEKGTFKLTSPILDCETTDQGEESVVSYIEVNDFVDTLKTKYSITNISVYFRDLNDGPWIGVNEKSPFSPASLLKVPALIGFLKYSEDNPEIPKKTVKVIEEDKKQILFQNVKPSKTLQVGNEYTLEEAAIAMIRYSDNIGLHVLSKNTPSKYIDNLYNAIGVTYATDNEDLIIRVKDYASFFRVLYNASYLNREMSEKALDILTKTEYKNGLVAGVPSDIIVAHKFGERSSGDVVFNGDVINGKIQIHDCGIIYYPGRPYILCIMTKGSNFQDQQKSIKDISAFFYNKINYLHS